MVVAPVDDRHVDGLAGQPLGRGQPAETGADDDDAGRLLTECMSGSVRRPAAVDRKRGAGDRAAAGAAQEDGQRAKLLDVGEALVGLRGEQHVADHLARA